MIIELKNICFCVLLLSTISCVNNTNQKETVRSNAIEMLKDSTFYSITNAVKNKKHVESLVLRDQKLEHFPIEIFELENLKYLDLSMNNFTDIPDGISQLKNLEELVIAYSKIIEVPNSIGGMRSLKKLVLLHSQVNFIDSSICNLENLESINLNYNQIRELPECICELQSLKELYILYKKGSDNIGQKKYQFFKKCLPNTRIAYKEIGVQ